MTVGPLRTVAYYTFGALRVPALDYWPLFPGTRKDGKQTYIVVADRYLGYADPTGEVLECGHRRPMPIWNGRAYFNRRRRCAECAMSGDA